MGFQARDLPAMLSGSWESVQLTSRPGFSAPCCLSQGQVSDGHVRMGFLLCKPFLFSFVIGHKRLTLVFIFFASFYIGSIHFLALILSTQEAHNNYPSGIQEMETPLHTSLGIPSFQLCFSPSLA